MSPGVAGAVLFGAILAAATPAFAQDTSGCAKFKWPVERERSAFASQGLPTIESGGILPGIMDPAILKLRPQADIAFEHAPGRKPKTEGTFAAVVKLAPVAVAGTYQVTLSDEAWIDMLQGGREIRSAAFSGQPNCPGVRKSVRFPLEAGAVTMQISGSAASSIKIEVLPAQ